VIAGFRREVDDSCFRLAYYAASNGYSLPTFRATYHSYLQGAFEDGMIGCPETWVRNCHYSLRNNPEERISHNAEDCKISIPFNLHK